MCMFVLYMHARDVRFSDTQPIGRHGAHLQQQQQQQQKKRAERLIQLFLRPSSRYGDLVRSPQADTPGSSTELFGQQWEQVRRVHVHTHTHREQVSKRPTSPHIISLQHTLKSIALSPSRLTATVDRSRNNHHQLRIYCLHNKFDSYALKLRSFQVY